MTRVLGLVIASLFICGQLLALRQPGPPTIIGHLSQNMAEAKGETKSGFIIDGETDDGGMLRGMKLLEAKGLVGVGPVLMVRADQDSDEVWALKQTYINFVAVRLGIDLHYDFDRWLAAMEKYFAGSQEVNVFVSAPTDGLIPLNKMVRGHGQWLNALCYTGGFNIKKLHPQLTELAKPEHGVKIVDISRVTLMPKGWDNGVRNMAAMGGDKYRDKLMTMNGELYEVIAPLQKAMNKSILLPAARVFEKTVTPEVLQHAEGLAQEDFAAYLGYLNELIANPEYQSMVREMKFSTIKNIETDAPLVDTLLAFIFTLNADEVEEIQGNWVYGGEFSRVEPSESGNAFSYRLTKPESVDKYKAMLDDIYLTHLPAH